jgi:hypothetical protein
MRVSDATAALLVEVYRALGTVDTRGDGRQQQDGLPRLSGCDMIALSTALLPTDCEEARTP